MTIRNARSLHGRMWIAAAVLLSLPACERAPTTAAGIDAGAADVHAAHSPGAAQLNRDIAALRALTAKFRDIEAAKDAGWNVLATQCRDNQPTGGMGFHWLNPAFVDDKVSVLEPEIVMYEPQSNGQMRFVGVEYIIPFDILPSTAEPPVLFGEQFLQNFNDNLWMMHVWVGRNNPDGLFATWNPKVSCEFAS